MKTVIIGSGNVAYHLSKALKASGAEILQIFGRNDAELSKLSKALNISSSTKNLAEADLYIISVSDAAVEEISGKIKHKNALVAHTSGSLPKEILKGDYRKASFYPLQTFSKNREMDYSKIPFFVEAENETDTEILKNLAKKISQNVTEASYEARKYIHLTAVFACNFSNHLYARAKEIADSQNIPFEYFLPLIDETAAKIHYLDPKAAQTGPAVRNDERILEMHREIIGNEALLKIYDTMNASIKEMYRKED